MRQNRRHENEEPTQAATETVEERPSPGRIVVENVNTPGKSRALDAANYNAMRRAGP